MSIDMNSQVTSSITSLEQEFSAIAHNLANVNTVGYKRIVTSFSEALDAQQSGAAADSSEAELNLGLDFSQGLSFIETGRSLDVALYGKGFFVVETPDGPLYTRNGSFKVNQNGQIVDSIGRVVAGEAGPITIGADTPISQINISNDGTVSADGQELGKFRLVDFGENEGEILPVGNSCFGAPEDVEPTRAENITVRQGYLESSNVKIVNELVSMIMVSRLYEANMKLVSTRKEASNGLMSVAMG
jgi:flagellar basal body rod protein FlgG